MLEQKNCKFIKNLKKILIKYKKIMKKLYQKSHQNKKTAVYTKTIIKQKIYEKK